MPWCLRNLYLDPELGLFSVQSTIFPENIASYLKWSTTWIITEYERANALFPLWTDSSMINIRPNMFLTSISAEQAINVLNQPNSPTTGLSPEQSRYFFDEYNKIVESRNILKFTAQKILQTISLYLHPLNSWGFPFEITKSPIPVDLPLFSIIKFTS